ncbi:nucleotidyltransferase family protein [Calothrix sp. FACHB-1219]|uniref:nucleotidyltransferase family protein n=1 Tax=unclassified Calothrix TaxID=2619626 RepID=UPI001683F9EE|nr:MULTISPECIES: nucleotidyltransferase family protein [unclassified Calothrix]MBD2203331.1 nucleotidyltransferase family protein [Calothrix sp. FACHB-168]MBD2216372.1 nucleotidyltransferase family protein [Calothrix sp. FACHB-1219]
MTIPLIILAAGASTRMGKPKQLLPYQGRSLIQHTVESAIASFCNPVIVVLGANAQQIRSQINQNLVQIVENPQWNLGMSTSIRSGISALNKYSQNIEAAVITVCDQPYISTEIINNLISAYSATKKPIIASQYAETLGVPALFSRQFFPELLTLHEDTGAKYLIKKYRDLVLAVNFPLGAIDIDTPNDYQNLQANIKLSE